MLEEKKLSNEEKENLQKSAELLSQVVIKNDSNPLGVKIIKDSCYQQQHYHKRIIRLVWLIIHAIVLAV